MYIQVYVKVIQLCIYIYAHTLFHIFSVMVYYRILNVVPCAIQ